MIIYKYFKCLYTFLFSKEHFVKTYFNNTVHVLKVDDFNKIKVASKRTGNTIFSFVKSNSAWGGINGGFFNHSDGSPVSKVYINDNLLDDPKNNKSLVNNKKLKNLLDKIFNRSELRLTEFKGQKKINICLNDYPLKNGERRLYSLQAGPQLLPRITLEEEAFISKDSKGNILRDGISSFSKVARSAVGITKEQNLIFVSIGDKGLTIDELSTVMKNLGAIKAMALDGGSSVSMVWTEGNNYKYFSSMGKNLALINSAILITN
ncbi:MAG: phosphodiester glycosidase family protein [Candidatus Sericytochromatia bacterium]